MAKWIVRSNAPSVAVEETRVVLRSKRRVSIKRGDELLLLSNEWVFTDKTNVLDTKESRSRLDSDEEKRWWEVHIDKWEPLPQALDLNDASTSLTFIRNWRRPKVHVRPAYRRLPDDDLETIERGDLFLARETYLSFVSALPPRLVQYFLAESTFPSQIPWDTPEYVDRAVALIRFIEERVLSLGKVVMAAQNQWDRLSSQTALPLPQPLYVWDEDEATLPINLTSQARIFGTLLSESREGSAADRTQLAEIRDILTSPMRRDVERRFERLFRNRFDERP